MLNVIGCPVLVAFFAIEPALSAAEGAEIFLRRVQRGLVGVGECGGQQNAGAVPEDMHSDADQQERGELHDHGYPGSSEDAGEAVGKGVAK